MKPISVFAEAFAILKQDGTDYFLSITPTNVRIDIAKQQFVIDKLSEGEVNKIINKPSLLDECQDKFSDLIVIAMNVVATEQTPKLVRNIKIPVPVVLDKPVYPSLLSIFDNCLNVGASINKTKIDEDQKSFVDKELNRFKASLEKDIEAAGGMNELFFENSTTVSDPHKLVVRSPKEIEKRFSESNSYLKNLGIRMNSDPIAPTSQSVSVVKDAYAIGVNEYLFDTIVSSLIPGPKQECTGWLDIAALRGRACYWVRLQNSKVTVNSNPPGLTGSLNVDVGGGIDACVRKFWDCSWSWACSTIGLAIKGRPSVTLELIKSNGVRILAQMGGNLYIDTGLPFPFNKVIEAVSSIIFKFVMAFVNVILGILSFYVIKPDIKFPEQRTKLKLRDFDSFFYLRKDQQGLIESKRKFIGFTGGVVAEL